MSGKSLRTIGDFVVIGTLDFFGVNNLPLKKKLRNKINKRMVFTPSLPVMGQRGFVPKALKGMDEVLCGEFHFS